ncbi:aminotransferase [Mobiluncus mulieris]|nr:aminotransferase [Mobiluncus mulieris]
MRWPRLNAQRRTVNPERLYLLSSTSQGYSWLMKLFCDPGDTVSYPTVYFHAQTI